MEILDITCKPTHIKWAEIGARFLKILYLITFKYSKLESYSNTSSLAITVLKKHIPSVPFPHYCCKEFLA